MSTSSLDLAKLEADLIRDEGLRLKPYKDTVGKITVGVGRNLTDRGISRQEASYLLQNDITEHVEGLFRALPWLATKAEPVQRALANMAFNLGVEGLLKFGVTLELIRKGDYEQAAKRILATKYAQQVGDRAKRVAELIRNGSGN